MSYVFNIQRDGTAQPIPLTGNYVEPQASTDLAPALLACFTFDIPDAAGDYTKLLPVGSPGFRITHIEVLKTGGDGGLDDSVQVKNGATAISDAISLNVADKTLTFPASLDDAQMDLAAGDTLKVTVVDGNAGVTNLSCRVQVLCVRK